MRSEQPPHRVPHEVVLHIDGLHSQGAPLVQHALRVPLEHGQHGPQVVGREQAFGELTVGTPRGAVGVEDALAKQVEELWQDTYIMWYGQSCMFTPQCHALSSIWSKAYSKDDSTA